VHGLGGRGRRGALAGGGGGGGGSSSSGGGGCDILLRRVWIFFLCASESDFVFDARSWKLSGLTWWWRFGNMKYVNATCVAHHEYSCAIEGESCSNRKSLHFEGGIGFDKWGTLDAA
jgi:hypothetical protein